MKSENPDIIKSAQNLINKINAAKTAPRNWYESDLVKKTGTFVEAFVLDDIKEWTPEGGSQVGWILYPLDMTVYSIGENVIKGQIELVSFEDINNIKPEIGDLVVVLRDNILQQRKAITLLRDKPDEL